MMRVLIMLAILGTSLAAPKTIQRIVGGEPTTIDKYPYMANMQHGFFSTWWYQACGGTVLTRDVVLSAAHCYAGDVPSDWRVLLGTSFEGGGGTVHPVSQIIMHERYNSPLLDNDIALIRLSVPAVYSDNIRPARVPGPHYVLPDGDDVTVIGWGRLTSGGTFPDQLQRAVVNVINQELCAERYAHLKTQPGFAGWPDITDGMLCTGILDVGGKDACQGDSGGPLLHDGDVVVGVTSWGYRCADAFYPGVNARISRYTSWIVSNVYS